MRRTAVRTLACLAWLSSSIAGPLISLVVLVHVANDHHHDAQEVQELALAASHGHHHSVDVAPHSHPAEREVSFVEPIVFGAALGQAVATHGEPSCDGPIHDAPAATESPPSSPPLFRKHCALLL